MARADHGMGEKHGQQNVGNGNPDTELAEDDFANEIHGNNEMQGKDQERFRNQRERQPDAKRETEGVVETYETPQPKRVHGDRQKKSGS